MRAKFHFLILIASAFNFSAAYSAETGDIYSLLYASQAGGTEPAKPPKEKGGIMGTIYGTGAVPQAFCSAGTCRAQNKQGAVLTLTGVKSLEEARSKIKAFEDTNGGRYQLTEWVSADGTMRWTPPPVAPNPNSNSQQAKHKK